MNIGKNNPCYTYEMEVNGQSHTIDSCNEEKDLGITFDRLLNFDAHIHNVTNKAKMCVLCDPSTRTSLDKHLVERLIAVQEKNRIILNFSPLKVAHHLLRVF